MNILSDAYFIINSTVLKERHFITLSIKKMIFNMNSSVLVFLFAVFMQTVYEMEGETYCFFLLMILIYHQHTSYFT